MRAIKFRGMILEEEWVYGNLSILTQKVNNVEAGHYISNSIGLPFAYKVRAKTVGQFTGLLDKNGKEIYEGDVYRNPNSIGTTKVIFKDGAFMGQYISHEKDLRNTDIYDAYSAFPINPWCEVIGNIYENPELLEKKC